MKEFNETSLETIIKIPQKSVFHFIRDGVDMGFLLAEENQLNDKNSTVFTPFTSNGILTETRCLKCALKSLINLHDKSGDFQPCDRRRASVGIEVHVISFGRQLH
ncbi:hypothetical protein WKG85_08955 [Pantoea agglomerans]|uniref:hypothetical protein n=1 Tax=Enterobacter agglomerans TaxID=549 RepID=UPI003C7A9538